MILITLISTSELAFIFKMTKTLDLNFVVVVEIKVDPFGPCAKNGTIHK